MANAVVRRLRGLRQVAARAGSWRQVCRRFAQSAVKLSSGFYRLPSQQTLLTERPWNALLILDACRADYFSRLRPDAVRVRSMGRFTRDWVWLFAHKVHPALGRPAVLWFTANVIPDAELASFGGAEGVLTVPLWETEWEFVGEGRIASVHPARVTGAVRRYVESHGQPERIIVHFLQPHSPYIGRRPLALTCAGTLAEGMDKHQQQMARPEHAVESGRVTWQDIRLAYMANLELVLPHALELARRLRGRVVITADHGELLGERGLFGHETSFYSRFVQIVPWLEFDNGPLQPAALDAAQNAPRDRALMENRLQALGYM